MGFKVQIGEKGERKIVHISALDKGILYFIIHPDFDKEENNTMRITAPVVYGSQVYSRIKELAAERGSRWGIHGSARPRTDIIVEPYLGLGANLSIEREAA